MGARDGHNGTRTGGPFAWSETPTPSRDLSDLAFGCCALFVATLVGLGFDALGLGACVVIVYVVAVQVTALVTIRRLHCLLGSTLGVALYNYFFTSPRHSLTAVGAAYPGAFVVMFATALISSYAAMALRREVHRSHEAQRRSSVMLETNRLLQGCADRGAIVNTAGAQLARMAHHACVWYQAQEDGSMAATSAYLPSGEKGLAQEFAPALPPLLDGSAYVGTPLGHEVAPELSRGVYLTVYDKAAEPADAGASQGGAPSEPVVAGVLAIDVDEAALGHDEANIAASIAGEASLALARSSALEQRECAAVTAKNEQLRANLLRSISHALRTPLTAIAGNADVLLSDAAVLTEGQRAKLAADIRSDATWLTSTVENLLAITKLENGGMSLNATVELMDDIIEEALRHVDPAVSEHSQPRRGPGQRRRPPPGAGRRQPGEQRRRAHARRLAHSHPHVGGGCARALQRGRRRPRHPGGRPRAHLRVLLHRQPRAGGRAQERRPGPIAVQLHNGGPWRRHRRQRRGTARLLL